MSEELDFQSATEKSGSKVSILGIVGSKDRRNEAIIEGVQSDEVVFCELLDYAVCCQGVSRFVKCWQNQHLITCACKYMLRCVLSRRCLL